ncbi:MAG: class I SAM-dependent methyltransferase [Gammaproteobacteria bacterium]
MAKKDKRGKRRKNRKKAGPSMAELADRHELYEASVQSVENEVEFLETAFTALTGRKPRHLREDFCGTAAAACEWVRSNRRHTAVGVDIDPEVLEWGRQRHVAALKKGQRARLELVEGDVRTARTEQADLGWTFRTREELLRYFRAVRRSLATDGVFFLDIYGGSDAYAESEEETDYDEFTYVWDQHRFDPLTADYTCYIHFRFPDGSELHRAFGYQWRLWTLPELRELLAEAGFAKSVVYWQTSDEDGEHTGEFEPVTSGDADPAWITYVAACKAG